MALHEKHDLMVAVIELFIIVPMLVWVPVSLAYWTSARAVQIPDEELRTGPGLTGVGAVAGGVVGAGFADLVGFATQKNFVSAMTSLGDGVVLMLLGGLTGVTGSIMLMRGVFRPESGCRDRERFGRAALSRRIRTAQPPRCVTAADKAENLKYCSHAAEFAGLIKADAKRISGGWRGFGAFVRMYVCDTEYRERNAIHARITAVCALTVAAGVSGTCWLAGTAPAGLAVAGIVTAEALGWAVMRWCYERTRLSHLSEACQEMIDELRRLCDTERQPVPKPDDAGRRHIDIRRTLALAGMGISLFAFIWSRHASQSKAV